MKRLIYPILKYLFISIFLITITVRVNGQTEIPEVLKKGTLKEQMKYIEDRTRIYENYRAIREDMFQKLKTNANDSLSAEKLIVNRLTASNLQSLRVIDSLSAILYATQVSLQEATENKNSITVLGIEFSKITYNLITWIIIAALLFSLVVGFLAFKRNMIVMIHTKKDLEELKNDFEDYRQKTREAREKISMDHFHEIKRLKGG